MSDDHLIKGRTSCSQLSLRRWIVPLTLGATAAVAIAMPLKAAEKIYFFYSPFIDSLRVNSLETFAKSGTIERDLAFYLNLAGVNEEQKVEFRQALLKRQQVNPVQLWRFFNTPTGEKILEKMGNLVAIQGGRNGKYFLRGALITAAFDEQNGLTLLNVLRHLATNVQINVKEVFQVADYISTLADGTTAIVDEMERLSEAEAKPETPVDFSQLPELRQPGNYGVAPMQTWELTARNRNPQRTFKVLVFRPQRWRPGKTPVVIISHGLSSNPEDFASRAKQLASYGYLVALPEHIGSNSQYLQELLEGYQREIYSANEFIERPLDVSDVIDELERRNQEEFQGRLNLQRVGVIGHSFGGYTALALAGAKIDFDNLAKMCKRQIWGPNLSLLLQCRALELNRQNYDFRDERVKAILAMNPVNSVIFGPQGLAPVEIPVFLGAGSNDPAAPVAIEQVRGFVWLNPLDKYLALVVGQAHVNFTKLDASTKALIDSLPDLTLPDQSVIDRYANALTVAFNEVYIAQNQEYLPYLTSAYAEYISRLENPLYFVNSSAEVPLSELFNELRPKEFPAIYPPPR